MRPSMTDTYPLTIEQLRVKLLSESVNAMQEIQGVPVDEREQKHTAIYRQRLEYMAGYLDQLISETSHKTMSRSYRFMREQTETRVAELMMAKEKGDEEIERSASLDANLFLLDEIIKMGY